MKKFKKGATIRRLRIRFSKLIRMRDKVCQRFDKCLTKKEDPVLHASHIYPKGHYRSMQFIPENAKTLCFRCHRWWHENPIDAQKWVKEYLGDGLYQKLHVRSLEGVTLNRDFFEKTEIVLSEFENALKQRQCFVSVS